MSDPRIILFDIETGQVTSAIFLPIRYAAARILEHSLQTLFPSSILVLAAVNSCPRLQWVCRAIKWRPFFTASWIFSLYVPSKMWSGFTQMRLSHLWQARLSGYFPCFKKKATRCAVIKRSAKKARPYVSRTLPFQGQHSFFPDTSTFAQNLAASLQCSLMQKGLLCE